VCSVVDPDESEINFGPLDPDPHWECRPGSGIQEGKKAHKKEKKFKEISCGIVVENKKKNQD
jgi:hypothetical protein